ncbi:uncharacterized protein PAC_05588 [Phialocephala subalpina]|uniref:Uncharacterized protein n=1 Tax=Phialocephala subalpina TaxID=576137 RepID=A0A1L7WSE7_9HELO|nr:uncharacterized protein PAC_05588 [Phialocephala subalpina]
MDKLLPPYFHEDYEGFSTKKLNYWIQTARAQPEQYRKHLLFRWNCLNNNYFFDEFFYFTYRERIWEQEWKGPPYISTRDLFGFLQKDEGKERICNAVITVMALQQRELPEIEQHLKYMRGKVESIESWILSISPPWNPHFAVCQFLTESDTPSIREFARGFEDSWFDHWDKPLKIWALAEIYHKVFPENYLAWCMGLAITSEDYKFLAYLLVKTYGEGDKAISDLEAGYKFLNSMPLEIAISAWKEMFVEPEQRINYTDSLLDRVIDTEG